MSKKSRHPAKQFDNAVVAVMHHLDRRWRVMVARLDGAMPSVVATEDFDDAAASRIEQWLDTHAPGQVIGVLPASNVICRTFTLPDIPEDQAHQALELQAEAHLLGIAPPHRMSMATLPTGTGETSSGLVLAWPESAESTFPDIGRPMVFAADIAGLAALLDDRRPPQPIVWADRSSGSIGIAMPHKGEVTFRATSEESSDGTTWNRALQRVITESAMSCKLDDDDISAIQENLANDLAITGDACMLSIPADVRDGARGRVAGNVDADANWWNRYGIALGIVLARSSSLATLTTMLEHPPAREQSIIIRSFMAMTQPRVAMRLGLAAAIILAFGPLVFAGARLAVLKWAASDLDEREDAYNRAVQQVEMYRRLDDRGRPITKLLSDINCNTPQGVELDSIRINADDAFSVMGTVAPHDGMIPQAVISKMSRQLLDTRIFTDISFDIGDESKASNEYSFSLSARIANPHRIASYDENLDFAMWTLEERINNDPSPSARAAAENAGDDAAADSGTETDTSTGGNDGEMLAGNTDTDDESGVDDNGAGNSASSGGLGGSSGALGGPGAGNTGGNGERPAGNRLIGQNNQIADGATNIGDTDAIHVPDRIPDILTDAQVAALTEQEARDYMADSAAARQYYDQTGDEEKRKAYQDQVMKMVDRLRDIRNGG